MDTESKAGRLDFVRNVRQKVGPRIIVLALVAGLSGYLMYSGIELRIGMLPFAVAAGLIYFGVVGTMATVLIMLKPAFGTLLELMAVSRLVVALAVVQNPEFGARVISSPMLSATLVVGGALLMRFATQLMRRASLPGVMVRRPT